jgi:hypothetical protein
VLWEWPGRRRNARSGETDGRGTGGRDLAATLGLAATGLGFLYFAWLFSATGIYSGRRGRTAVLAAEAPEQFALVIAVMVFVGAASLVSAIVMVFRR